jgi:hypothetical protein
LPTEVAKLNLINKLPVFLMTVARFNRCGRMTLGRLGHTPTLGQVQIRLNMIHGSIDQNKTSQHCWQRMSLHQNEDCSRLRCDMNLRFDVYESRLYELSRKYLHARI